MACTIVLEPRDAGPAILAPAVEALRRGKLVILPTDTVYGLAARADQPEAVAGIYAAKRRPVHKPLSYHAGSWDMIRRIAPDAPAAALAAMRRCLPGPYTFLVASGGRTVGIRFPDHPVCSALLGACEFPVAATSANISGEPSPLNIAMAGSVRGCAAVIVDAGPTPLQGESTIVDLTVEPPACVRQGIAPWPKP